MTGQDIKEARENLNLSLRDLAELSGVPHTTIYRIEQGNPSAYQNFIKVLDALSVRHDDIEAKNIIEQQLVSAWRNEQYGTILDMIAKRIKG